MVRLADWIPCAPPARQAMSGRFVRLEPLDPDRHGDGLFALSTASGMAERFRFLGDHPPGDRQDLATWLRAASRGDDPICFVAVDAETGRIAGRQNFMRIDAANGVVEIGNILWGPDLARRAGASEALYLFARHVFDDLGYRRFEWKCNDLNAPSKRAALRFGFTFEGLFRQHMIVKGENRDTAWFAMLDHEWPLRKQAFEMWLDGSNFDNEGRQRRRLEDIRASLAPQT